MKSSLSKLALSLFKDIASKNRLKYRIDEPPEAAKPIEYFFIFPKQKGLDFEMCLYVDNFDELRIDADDYCISYFPYGKGNTEKFYLEAVNGLIQGKCRLLKYYTFFEERHYKTKMQKLEKGKWKTLNTYRSLVLKIPFLYGKTLIVQNSSKTK